MRVHHLQPRQRALAIVGAPVSGVAYSDTRGLSLKGMKNVEVEEPRIDKCVKKLDFARRNGIPGPGRGTGTVSSSVSTADQSAGGRYAEQGKYCE